jgi:Na+/glutamate symporter
VDATTIGAVLACVGVVSGSVVTFLGRRGESKNSLTDQLQEELASEHTQRKDAQAEADTLRQHRRDDLVRITQLEIEIIRLGGTVPHAPD